MENDEWKMQWSTVPSRLLQSGPIRHIFRERGNHGPPFFTNRSSNNHSLRFIPAKLARFEVCHHDHLAAYKLLRFVVFSNAGKNLARPFFTKIYIQQQQLVRLRHTL